MPGFVVLTELWITLSSCLVAGGWVLSALGQLNIAGYVFVFALTALICWRVSRSQSKCHSLKKMRGRFRRSVPFLFLLLAVCALVGGVLYPPTNYDGLAYRVPRVLNWLVAEKWHWIDTLDARLNVRAAGFEWLMSPLMLFTKGDRFTFVINWISFLLLPGLVFSVFTRIGVRSRVAWYWMWLIPGGYAFALQAGSIANDLFAAVYVLAAIDFALRAEESKRFRYFVFSLLGIALTTGAKASNMPLGLPWLVAAGPMLVYWLRRRPVVSASIAAVALFVSYVPTAVLNRVHCGDWTGVRHEEKAGWAVSMKNPVLALGVNAPSLLAENLVPPFFVIAGKVNPRIPQLLPGPVLSALKEQRYDFTAMRMPELPLEDISGIGFGTTVLLLVGLAASAVRRAGRGQSRRPGALQGWRRIAFYVAPFVALGLVLSKSAFTCARIATPHYPLVFGVLLVCAAHRRVIAARWWRLAAMAMMALSVFTVLLTPPRPLLPVQAGIRALERVLGNSLLSRIERVYTVYKVRQDGLGPIREALPGDVKTIGLLTFGNDLQVSLWRPYFQKRLVYVTPAFPVEALRAHGVQYLVIGHDSLQHLEKTTPAEWCAKHGAKLYRHFSLSLRASRTDEEWSIVRLD